MSLLVATDLSDDRALLIRLAAALGKGGRVYLVHVAPDGVPDSERATREAKLAAEAQALREHGIDVEAQLDAGSPVERILSRVWSLDVGMVALGGAAGQRRLGAVATAVVAACPVPVLVARGAASEVRTHLRVFVGVDHSPASTAAVQWAAGVPGASVHLAHVWHPMQVRARLGTARVVDPEAPAPEVLHALEADCRESAGRSDLPVHLAAVLPDESEAEALMNLCTRQGADVVVLGVHGRRGGAGPVLDAALTRGTLPVVAVPDLASDHALPRYRRVLVAVDFSEPSVDAVSHAFTAAGPRGVVHLVHIRPPSFAGLDEERRRDMEDRDRLLALVPRAGLDEGTGAVAHPAVGADGPKALAQLAERLAADLIVVGAQPHSAVYSTLVGSFVDSLLRTTLRPVLVIRPRG